MPIITKQLATSLRGEVLAALQTVAEKHGLRVSVQKSNYNEAQYNAGVVFETLGETGAPIRFAFDAGKLGIAPDCWNKQVIVKSEPFTITGIDLGRPRFPVTAVRVRDGRRFKLTQEQVSAVYPAPAQKP